MVSSVQHRPQCCVIQGKRVHKGLKVCIPVTNLPDAWRKQVSGRTGWPRVSTMRLCEVDTLTCHFFLYLCRSVPDVHFVCCWDAKVVLEALDRGSILAAALYLVGWTGITGPHPSPKSLTCWLQEPQPGTAPQQAC